MTTRKTKLQKQLELDDDYFKRQLEHPLNERDLLVLFYQWALYTGLFGHESVGVEQSIYSFRRYVSKYGPNGIPVVDLFVIYNEFLQMAIKHQDLLKDSFYEDNWGELYQEMSHLKSSGL